MFCRETLLVCLLGCSEKIGSPKKTAEIDESKFGRRKDNMGHPVKGQWVFVCVERESGRTFLVPLSDRTADTLTSIIRAWIEPGTTHIRDCWAAYQDIGSNGYPHRTVNHSISFINPDTRDHTNHIESTWCHVKAFLRPYNRQEDYKYHFAHYMFAARCNALVVSQFTQFLAIAASRYTAMPIHSRSFSL
jgi:transposase-like protein